MTLHSQVLSGNRNRQSISTANTTPTGPRHEKHPEPINMQLRVILAASATPQKVEAYRVPPGSAVRIEANNGSTSGNTGTIWASRAQDSYARGFATPFLVGDDKPFPVSNTGEIWITGNANDGCIVYVVTPAGGNNS